MTDDEMLEARKRAEEYRKMAEEECPDGGFLFGDDIEPSFTHVKDLRETKMTCPDHLSELARLEWNRIVSEHPTEDTTTLAAYCAAYGRWVDAEQKINEFGVVIKTKTGNAQTNPYVAVAEQSLNIMHKFLGLLNHKTDPKTVF